MKVEVEKLATKVKDQLAVLITDLSKTCEALEGFVKEIFKDATKIAEKVNEWIGDTFDVAGYRKKLENEIKTAIDGSAKTIAEIKAAAAAAAARITEEAEARARQLAGTIQETVRDITGGADLADLARRADGVYQKGDSALRALRALGDPPKTNNLGFNRPRSRLRARRGEEAGNRHDAGIGAGQPRGRPGRGGRAGREGGRRTARTASASACR